MTAWGRDIRAVSMVSVLTASIVLAFPKSALRFKANKVCAHQEASAAFVTLSADEEAAALSAAKTAWQSDAISSRRMRVRLQIGDLPEEPEGTFFGMANEEGDKTLTCAEIGPVPYDRSAYNPIPMAEGKPKRKSSGAAVRKSAFSREELLNL